MTDQTRAAFEAHFGLTTWQKWQHPDGSYKFPEIQAKWEGYLAGVAKAAPHDSAAIRNEALEEAAKMIDDMHWGWDGDGGAAENIRGMKHAPVATAAPVAVPALDTVQGICDLCENEGTLYSVPGCRTMAGLAYCEKCLTNSTT